MQLQVVLQRLGCDGNGVSVGRMARLAVFSVGTVCKFTDRVFTALLRLRKRVISWPKEDERHRLSAYMRAKYGIPGGILIIDGTPAVFYQRPGVDGEVYWTRKCHYAMNLQLICEFEISSSNESFSSFPSFSSSSSSESTDSKLYDGLTFCRVPKRASHLLYPWHILSSF